MTQPLSVNTLVCPRCGAQNGCGVAQGQAACWCMQLPPLQNEQAAVIAAACFCPNCLTELTATGQAEQSGQAQQYKPESAT
jgi:hypothetical protein